jgi:hypothetical protein
MKSAAPITAHSTGMSGCRWHNGGLIKYSRSGGWNMNDWLGNFDGKLPGSVQPADFAYWCRASRWELEEAAHIALGAEPKSGQGYVLVRGRRSVDRRWKEEPFIFAAERLTELVQRRFYRSRGLNFVKPGEFVSWMGDAHLPIPHELSAALARFGDSHTDWKQRAETAENEVEDLKQRNAELETAIANQTINGLELPPESGPPTGIDYPSNWRISDGWKTREAGRDCIEASAG